MGNKQSKNESDSDSKEKKKKKPKPTIIGYARRKGEHNPSNYGWAISDELAEDPRWKDSTELPPVGGFKKDKDGLKLPQKNKAHEEGFAQGWAAAQQRGGGGGGAGFMQPGGGFPGTFSQPQSR